ncbi:MAG: hypothetical protein Q8Q09_01675 [Deltaproteobacteria bacterium]|nr:hypothetical protein [Deltaproteobacteria bacterium]
MANPSNIAEFLKTTAIVGGTGAVAVVGTNYLLDGTSLTDVSKAFVQTSVHLVLGAMIGRVAPRLGAGVAIGGIVGGAAKLEREVRVRSYIRSLTEPRRMQATAPTQAAPPQVGTGQTTAAAGSAYADVSPLYVGR